MVELYSAAAPFPSMFTPLTSVVPSSRAFEILGHTASTFIKQFTCQVDRLFSFKLNFDFEQHAAARANHTLPLKPTHYERS